MKVFKSKKITKSRVLWTLILLVFLFPQISYAFWGESAVTLLAELVISKPLNVLFAVCNTMLAGAIALVDLTVSTKLFDAVFFSAPGLAAINVGWGLVRDFVNMFFILILVFLAIATILRINKFSDKRLLLYVVMAALLVNFSKPISLFLIDTSNLAMGFFIENIRGANESYANAFLNNANFGEVFKKVSDKEGVSPTMSLWVSQIAASVFSLIMAGMLLLLSISLVIRLVAFWVLIVLSPIAFLGMALPGTFLTQFKDGWFRKMIYWCFYGPVMLFFLWLSLIMITAMSLAVQGSIYESQFEMAEIGLAPFTSIIQFIAAIYLLFYGYDLSKSIANSGAGAAGNLLSKGGQKFTNWGKKGAALAGNVASLGLAGAAYNQARAAKEGMSDRNIAFGLGPVKYRNKKAKEELHKKRTARYAGNSAQFQSGEVNEKIKEWDEKGAPSANELRVMVGDRKVNEVQRQAAAMRLAKEGEMDAQTYRSAVALTSKNPKLRTRLEETAKKKNMHAVLEHKIEQETEKRRREGNSTAGVRKGVYEEALKGMKMGDIIEQDSKFHEDKEFADYMRKNTGEKNSGKRFDSEALRKQAAEKMDETKQAAWFGKGGVFNPDSGSEERVEGFEDNQHQV